MRALALLLSALALLGCSARETRSQVKPLHTLPATQVFVGEAFQVTPELRCRVAGAERELTDPRTPSALAEDLLVLKVQVRCAGANGQDLPAREALPDQARVLLVAGDHAPIAPSLRTRVSEHEPESYVFELAPDVPVLAAPRRFDARTGEPLSLQRSKPGKLEVTLPDRQIAVTLAQRELDPAFDRWLAALARALASNTPQNGLAAEAQAQLARAQALYARVFARFVPRELTLHAVRTEGSLLVVELALEGASAREAVDPIALLTLSVRRAGDDLTLLSLLEEASTLRALRCADELESLGERVERAFQGTHAQGECNALGVILPGPCESQDAQLLEDALDVRARCIVQRSVALPPARAKAADDVQLTLRRGKQASGLDREPRYVLALHPGGQVVFHGRHWVSSTERRDGRTPESALRAVLARFDQLEFFERKGGEWDPEHCSPEEDMGNVLTLHARGRERMVVDREGCRGPFTARELAGLVQAIEATAGVSAWTTPRPRYADPGQQVWTVSAD